MASVVANADVAISDANRRAFASLRIVGIRGAPILILSAKESAAANEESTQLLEGRAYEFEVIGAPIGLRMRETAVVQRSAVHRSAGRLETGLSTGLLTLVLEDDRGVPKGHAALEVRSEKLDYGTDYRVMLEHIAEEVFGLLLRLTAPTAIRLTHHTWMNSQSIHQRLALLRSLLGSDELQAAVTRIIADPHKVWTAREARVEAERPSRSSARLLSQIAAGTPRVRVPPSHTLYELMSRWTLEPSLPATLALHIEDETLDTAENRFVKHILLQFAQVLSLADRALRRDESVGARALLREVRPLKIQVESWLAAPFFREVGDAHVAPLGSPVLQRRAGYRELLGAWLKFQLASRLTWTGSDEVYPGGMRDTAALYEYWVFFRLLAIVRELFVLDPERCSPLIGTSANGFDVKLRRSHQLNFDGWYLAGSRPLSIRFSYNRTFSGSIPFESGYPSAGSWTRSMRPDFTLSLWPDEFLEDEAERQELMVHIHFDAKYRVDTIAALFGSDDEDATGQDEHMIAGPLRSDLLKMHAYRDAIRRTQGAYVLYPGRTGSETISWYGFHELLPGLGAFALRPGHEAAGVRELSDFIREVVEHLCSLSTRREQLSYHQFRVEERSGNYRADMNLPDVDAGGHKLRRRPAIER